MWKYALVALLNSVISFAQISPIVPVNQPYSSYHRYGLGPGNEYSPLDPVYGASLYGGSYGGCHPCCPPTCSRLGGISGGNYYGYGAIDNGGYEWPLRGYSNYLQPSIGYPPIGFPSSELLGSSPFSMAGDCQDQSPQCALWASTGQCASNAVFMNRVCPQSCGTACLGTAIGNYGTLTSGYGLTSSYDPYGSLSKYGLGFGSSLLGPSPYNFGTGYGIDSITNPLYKIDGGYGLGSVAGSGYGFDPTYDLGSGGFGTLYGNNYGSRAGFNNYGLGIMDGLADNYGIDSGYSSDSTAALLSKYAILSGSRQGLGFGPTLDPYDLRSGYGSYGNDYYGRVGGYQSGIYPYSQKEKKLPSTKTSNREEKRKLTRLLGAREQ